jgi:hypothetical protein
MANSINSSGHILGGCCNSISGGYSTISGGCCNSASGYPTEEYLERLRNEQLLKERSIKIKSILSNG